MTELYIGVDIGGTSTRIGLFQSLAETDFTLSARFPTQQEYEQQMQAIIDAIRESTTQPLTGIGVSIGGRLAKDGRSVLVAPNLPAYVGKPFAQDLERQVGCRVALAHDTVCGLLGEKKFGQLRTSERCAYLTLSTGTGAAVHLSKGAIALTLSIEVGHQLLDGNTLQCLCGQAGCLETYTGGRQLEQRLGTPTEQITDSAFWDVFTDKLALGLVNLAHLTRVETIAVSGAIALHNRHLLALLQQKIGERICGATLELRLALLGENAPLIGAVTLLEVPADSILH